MSSETIIIGDFYFEPNAIERYLLNALPNINSKGFSIVFSNDQEYRVGYYTVTSNEITLDNGCEFLINTITDMMSGENSSFVETYLQEARRSRMKKILTLSGYEISKFVANRSFSLLEEVVNVYCKADSMKLVEHSYESVGKFVIATILWHEATHAAKRDHVLGVTYHHIGKKIKQYASILSLSILSLEILRSQVPAKKSIFKAIALGMTMFLLGNVLQFKNEYPAAKSQQQLNEICGLAKLINKII